MTYLASTASFRTERFGSSRTFANSLRTVGLHGCNTSYRTMLGKRARYRRADTRTRYLIFSNAQDSVGGQLLTTEDVSSTLLFFSIRFTRVALCSETMLFSDDSSSATAMKVSITLPRMSMSGKSRPRNNRGINYLGCNTDSALNFIFTCFESYRCHFVHVRSLWRRPNNRRQGHKKCCLPPRVYINA